MTVWQAAALVVAVAPFWVLGFVKLGEVVANLLLNEDT